MSGRSAAGAAGGWWREAAAWRRTLAAAALVAAGYIVLIGAIWLLERLGAAAGRPGLGVLGLAADVALLAGVLCLGRRYSQLTSALGPLLGLLAVFLLFAAADWWWNDFQGHFWDLLRLRTIAVQSSTIAVGALGMTVIIIAGGIDLSAGTGSALCATVLAWRLDQGDPVGAALAACVATGCLCGLLNGALISMLRVVPFIVTLGTMTAFLGAAKLIAKETTVRPPLEAIPQWLGELVRPTPSLEWLAWPLLPNFAWGVWLALLLALLLAGLLHGTVFGRRVFAIGSNETAARLCGVHVARMKIAVYTLGGLFMGVAGAYQFARLNVGNPTSGVGMELKVIAAVVIGGGSLSGGRGSVVGTLTGAAIMQVIASGCNALGLSNPIQDIIIGAIIVAAVAMDQLRQARLAPA